MTASELVRINSAYSMRGGALFPSPIAEAAERWGPDGNVDRLRAWLKDETTIQMVGLIQEMALNPPSGFVSVNTIENYGVTTGLQLATRVLQDPTILFSDRFEKASPGQSALPEPDYSTSAYEGEQT